MKFFTQNLRKTAKQYKTNLRVTTINTIKIYEIQAVDQRSSNEQKASTAAKKQKQNFASKSERI